MITPPRRWGDKFHDELVLVSNCFLLGKVPKGFDVFARFGTLFVLDYEDKNQ